MHVGLIGAVGERAERITLLAERIINSAMRVNSQL